MKALDIYNNYTESDEEFSYILRMEYEWKDEKYKEMMRIVRDVFLEFQEELVIPKALIHFFTKEIDVIVGLVSNSIFFNSTPDNFTKEQYEKIVLKGKSELLELKELFFSGDFYRLSSHTFFI